MQGIVDYLRERNPVAAVRFVEAAQATFEHVAFLPQACSRMRTENPALVDVRWRPLTGAFRRYLVFYRISDDGVCSLIVQLVSRGVDAETRDAWVVYFAASGSESFLPFLDAWLEDPDENRRLSIICALAWNRAAGTNDVLLRTIQHDPSQPVRRLALKFLVRRGSFGYWEPCDLSTVVRNTDWRPVTRREYAKLMARSSDG